jgi:hypothetical protein
MFQTRFDRSGKIVPRLPPLISDKRTGAGGVLGVNSAHVAFKRETVVRSS